MNTLGGEGGIGAYAMSPKLFIPHFWHCLLTLSWLATMNTTLTNSKIRTIILYCIQCSVMGLYSITVACNGRALPNVSMLTNNTMASYSCRFQLQ